MAALPILALAVAEAVEPGGLAPFGIPVAFAQEVLNDSPHYWDPKWMYEHNTIMPTMLVDAAKTIGCEPVPLFYETTRGIDPPFLFGIVRSVHTGLDSFSGSYVFWCQRENKQSQEMEYILAFGGNNISALKCPHMLVWPFFPGGLEKGTDSRPATFKGYVPLDRGSRSFQMEKVPADTFFITSVPGEGLSDVFACYKGRWLVMQFD